MVYVIHYSDLLLTSTNQLQFRFRLSINNISSKLANGLQEVFFHNGYCQYKYVTNKVDRIRLTNRLELLFLDVLALPKASNRGPD